MIELNKFYIPENLKTAKNDNFIGTNQIFMLKIKVRHETNIIYVGAPDKIYADRLQNIKLFSLVQSLKDVIHVEFYDVLEEGNFDPKI